MLVASPAPNGGLPPALARRGDLIGSLLELPGEPRNWGCLLAARFPEEVPERSFLEVLADLGVERELPAAVVQALEQVHFAGLGAALLDFYLRLETEERELMGPVLEAHGAELAPALAGRSDIGTADRLVLSALLGRPADEVVGEILELRPLAVDCDMDAGGMPLIWFEPVPADASVAWLSGLVTAPPEGRGRVPDQALSAIAQHAGQGATTSLLKFAQSATTTQMRGRALSALAQRAAEQALPAIDAALQKDPDTEVKKLAVNALTRFPTGEGIPKLMEVARTHPNADVRRQAMLRLGDTRDPRVVDFFAQILLK